MSDSDMFKHHVRVTEPPSMALDVTEDVNLGEMGWQPLPNGHHPIVFAPPDPTHDRIDLLYRDGGRIVILTGTPGPVPMPPPLPGGPFPAVEPLAYVRVRAGSTSLSAGDVDSRVVRHG